MELEEIEEGFAVGKLRLQEGIAPVIIFIHHAVPFCTGAAYRHQDGAAGIMNGRC